MNCFLTIPTFPRCKRNLTLVNSLTVPHLCLTVTARCYPDYPRWCHDKCRFRPVVAWRLCAPVLQDTELGSEHHIRSVSRSRVWYHNDHKEETNRESGQLQLVMHHLKSVVVHYEVFHRVSKKSS